MPACLTWIEHDGARISASRLAHARALGGRGLYSEIGRLPLAVVGAEVAERSCILGRIVMKHECVQHHLYRPIP